jgi:hypothetical protein
MPRWRETSPLKPASDPDSLVRSWRKSGSTASQAASLTRSVQLLQRQIETMRRRKGGIAETDVAFHPFKIYASPTPAADWVGWTTPGYTNEDLWRFFRVRAGKLGTTDVQATDGDGLAPHPAFDTNVSPNVDPDLCGMPEFDGDDVDLLGSFEFIVGDGELWYFWLDSTDLEAPYVNAGDTAPTAHWPGSNYVLLGTVDCTDSAGRRSIIRQIRRADVTTTKGCVDGEYVDIPV